MKIDSKKESIEFHFSGTLEYEPITIVASDIEEATKEWEKIRKPIGSASTLKEGEDNQTDHG